MAYRKKIITILLIFYAISVSECDKQLYKIEYLGLNQKGILDEYGGGNTKIIEANGGDYQKWWVEEATFGYVYIESFRSQNVLDSNEEGNVYTLPKNGGHFQHWSLQPYAYQNQIFIFRLKNRATGRFLSKDPFSDDTQTDETFSKERDDYLWKFYPI